MPASTTEQVVECEEKCKTEEYSCCIYECRMEVSGTVVEGKLHTENMYKGYEVYFDLMNTTADIREAWIPVIKKSFETCEKLSKN